LFQLASLVAVSDVLSVHHFDRDDVARRFVRGLDGDAGITLANNTACNIRADLARNRDDKSAVCFSGDHWEMKVGFRHENF
jgi:hypothetical protein